jgi:hypothetical protein
VPDTQTETTAPATESQQATESDALTSLPNEPGALEPGTYTTNLFKPAMSLTIDEGWEMFLPEIGRFFSIARGGDVLRLITVSNLARLVAPTWNGDEATLESSLIPVPDDLARWFAAHPRHQTGPIARIRVGDVEGQMIDARTVSGYKIRGCLPDGCVLLLVPQSDFTAFIPVGYTTRHVIVEVDDETIVISILAPHDAFDEFLPEAMRVVSSLRFRLPARGR